MPKQKFNFNAINQATQSQEEVATLDEKKQDQSETSSTVGSMVKKISETKIKSAFEVIMIPRNRLRENKKNKYPKEKMKSLEESILNFGLIQNLNVIYLTDEDIYVLEVGHRRCAALDNLISRFFSWEGDPEDSDYLKYQKNVAPYEKGYPCRVSDRLADNIEYDSNDLETLSETVIDSEIRLIISNEETRDKDPVVRADNVARLAALYEAKNIGKSRKDMINVNEKIAQDLGISERQVINYKSIDSLIPELQQEFKNNNITLKASSNYAKLEVEEQQLILQLIKSGQKVNTDEITQMKKERELLEKKLKAAEEDLASKVSSEPSSPESEVDSEKDTEINSLKVEIKKLKEAKQKDKNIPMSSTQADLIKKDLMIKSQLDICEKQIKTLVEQIKDLSSLKEAAPDVSVISQNELRDRIYNLIQILQAR